jgi:hypothetical protein
MYKNSDTVYSVTAQLSDSYLHNFVYSVGIKAGSVDTPKLWLSY